MLSTAEVVMFVSRTYASNPSAFPGAVRIFWANSAALMSFADFLSVAVARRRQSEVHRRLMLLAAITLVQPAMARIRQVWFPEMDGARFAIVWLALLVGAIAVHDLRVTRRVHPVTVVAGLWFLGSRLFAQFVIAPSQFGAIFVRRFVE